MRIVVRNDVFTLLFFSYTQSTVPSLLLVTCMYRQDGYCSVYSGLQSLHEPRGREASSDGGRIV
jgi:hypothetical protein